MKILTDCLYTCAVVQSISAHVDQIFEVARASKFSDSPPLQIILHFIVILHM